MVTKTNKTIDQLLKENEDVWDNVPKHDEYTGFKDGKFLAVESKSPDVSSSISSLDFDKFIKEKDKKTKEDISQGEDIEKQKNNDEDKGNFTLNSGDYSGTYDAMQMAGLSLDAQRTANPFAKSGVTNGSIQLFKSIDPNMYSRSVERVEGVRYFGSFGMAGPKMNAKQVEIPKGYTQREYAEYLINSIPQKMIRARIWDAVKRSHYSWCEHGSGGSMTDKEIAAIKKVYPDKIEDGTIIIPGVRSKRGSKTRQIVYFNHMVDYRPEINKYKIDFWCFPHYMRWVVEILRSDYRLTEIGFSGSLRTTVEQQILAENFAGNKNKNAIKASEEAKKNSTI